MCWFGVCDVRLVGVEAVGFGLVRQQDFRLIRQLVKRLNCIDIVAIVLM